MSHKYTKEQLKEAFEKVQDSAHWKNPINSCCRGAELEVTREAIRFFTGTETEFFYLDNGWYKIKADGYRLGPCGDH